MKPRALIVLLAGLLAGIGAYAAVYLIRTGAERRVAASPEPALAWMRDEFGLTEEQFRRLNELHEAYRPRCEEMCGLIDAKTEQLNELLRQSRGVTPEVRSVLNEAAALRAECQARMLEHFYRVADSMPPEQGERYLNWIKAECFGHPPADAGRPPQAPHQHHMR